MPQTRVVKRRKGVYARRRRVRKVGPTTKVLAQKIKKIEGDQELKQRQGVYTGMTLTPDASAVANTNYALINDSLDQGTGVTDRIGDQVRITSAMLRLRITTDKDSLTSTLVRCIVFWDKQANGAVYGYDGTNPNLGANLGPLLTPDSGVSMVYAHYNPYTCGGRATRYKILYDKIWTINPQTINNFVPATGVTTTTNLAVIQKNLKIKVSKKMQFKRGNTTGYITDIQTGALWCVMVSDSIAGQQPSALISFKLNYKDQ